MPAGVPELAVVVVVDDEPPHPQTKTSRTRAAGSAKIRDRRKLVKSTRPNAPNASIPPASTVGGRTSNKGRLADVPGAVVATFTATAAAELPFKFTELGMLQVGADSTAGVIAQLKFTDPLKEPVRVSVRLNVALSPADTVAEPDCPDSEPQTKPFPTPVRLTVCGELDALSFICIVPSAVPGACGVNCTEMVQLVPAARLEPQLFVWKKYPLCGP
jgi:hypothetical protein